MVDYSLNLERINNGIVIRSNRTALQIQHDIALIRMQAQLFEGRYDQFFSTPVELILIIMSIII